MIRRHLNLASVFLALIMLIHVPMGTAYVTVGYAPEKTDFTISYRDERSSERITPIFLLPGETVSVQFSSDIRDAVFSVSEVSKVGSPAVDVASSKLVRAYPATWSLTAPRKVGSYQATVENTSSGKKMDLSIFVMVPFEEGKSGSINGYKIGDYPRIPVTKRSNYDLPRGFVEVTKENKDLFLTPHFKLSQFLCKQSGTFPQYIVLRERLLFKLEYVLEHVNKKGIPARTFSVMSGYRTPYYNRALGNVKLSRHMFGDAADIYINNDPRIVGMQDLNADGKTDIKDAELLYGIVNQLNSEPSFERFIGGLGRYKPTSSHGPFVHVDARGSKANWGGN